jgi:pyruvate formate lyase activating enzyme
MTGPVTEKEAVIFDVQSFSIHDGPGIRTTVFFKGCPLNCMWCHNPESKGVKPQLLFHKNLCVGCMLCVGVCESGAQLVLSDGSRDVDHERCTGCGKCAGVCCYDALTISGKRYRPEELLERLRSDMRYFNLEGGKKKEKGGVSFSGGEPLGYAGFIKAFCGLIPGIHRVLETSGYGERKDVEELLDCIDLFLFDIKFIDPEEHRKWCGIDNTLILENLAFLYERKKEILLRLPFIQGINDTPTQFDGIAGLLRQYPEIMGAEILPYHNYVIGKAESLGRALPPELPRQSAGNEIREHWLEEFRARDCTNVWCA